MGDIPPSPPNPAAALHKSIRPSYFYDLMSCAQQQGLFLMIFFGRTCWTSRIIWRMHKDRHVPVTNTLSILMSVNPYRKFPVIVGMQLWGETYHDI